MGREGEEEVQGARGGAKAEPPKPHPSLLCSSGFAAQKDGGVMEPAPLWARRMDGSVPWIAAEDAAAGVRVL